VDQVGFSLHEYIEMYVQKKIKFILPRGAF